MWQQPRPLPDHLLQYAADDVRYLLPLAHQLRADLAGTSGLLAAFCDVVAHGQSGASSAQPLQLSYSTSRALAALLDVGSNEAAAGLQYSPALQLELLLGDDLVPRYQLATAVGGASSDEPEEARGSSSGGSSSSGDSDKQQAGQEIKEEGEEEEGEEQEAAAIKGEPQEDKAVAGAAKSDASAGSPAAQPVDESVASLVAVLPPSLRPHLQPYLAAGCQPSLLEVVLDKARAAVLRLSDRSRVTLPVMCSMAQALQCLAAAKARAE
jgi:hypothetical protein